MVGDQCRYGLVAKGQEGYGPARKSTGFMTNSPCIALQLQRRCPNRDGYQIHKHVRLERGRTKAAQVYPLELCKVICRGLIKQIEADRNSQHLLMNIEHNDSRSSGDLMETAGKVHEQYRTIEEGNDEEVQIAWDDVSGAELDPQRVRRAREEDIAYVNTMGLYNKVPTQQCYERTGKAPIFVRWIDINKGGQ